MTEEEARKIIDMMDVWEKFSVWNHYQTIQAKLRCMPFFYWTVAGNRDTVQPLTVSYQGNSLQTQTMPFDEFIKEKIYDWYWRFN